MLSSMGPEVKHYVGEEGVPLIVKCGVDLSTSVTVAQIRVKKPDGTIVTWTASVYTYEGVTQYLRYYTVEDDLDQSGEYEAQAYVERGSWKVHGESFRFMIYVAYS